MTTPTADYNTLVKLLFFSNKCIDPNDVIKAAKLHIERVCSVNNNMTDLITLSMIKDSIDLFTCHEYHQRLEYMFLQRQNQYHLFISQKC